MSDIEAQNGRLRAALKQARQTLISVRTPLEADKDARGAAVMQINLALGEHPAGPFAAELDGAERN